MIYPKFYKHYATQYNVTEDEQYESDVMDTPNNPLAGYIVWMHRMLSQYKKSQPSSFIGDTPTNLKKLDMWLSSIIHPDS